MLGELDFTEINPDDGLGAGVSFDVTPSELSRFQTLAEVDASESAEPMPTANTRGAAVSVELPAQSYAATRGAADETALRGGPVPAPTAVLQPDLRQVAFRPIRLRPRGRARRPSCNGRTRGSRRSRATSRRSRSPAPSGDSGPLPRPDAVATVRRAVR